MAHKPPFLRTEHNYDMLEASNASALDCKDPSLAQQHFAEECDINTIVERFHLTGETPQLTHIPSVQDYEGIFDFQDAMNVVRAAQEQFMTVPAKIRARFNNDPQKFLEFFQDDDNRAEAIKMGLLATPLPGTPAETPTDVPSKPQTPSAATPTPTPNPGQ